jgi:hypothetical protein
MFMSKSDLILGSSDKYLAYKTLSIFLNECIDRNESLTSDDVAINDVLRSCNESNLTKFFFWANNILSRLVISDDQAKRDPNTKPNEAPDLTIKDREDIVLRLARMLVGLQYYASKNDASVNKTINNLDKSIEDNIKAVGSRINPDDVITLAKKIRDPKQRSEIKGLIDRLTNYYTTSNLVKTAKFA